MTVLGFAGCFHALVGRMTSRCPTTRRWPPPLVREPFHRDGWIYEEKVDGRRMLAYKDDDSVRLISRHGRDHSRRFSDIQRQSPSCGQQAVL